jgi:hypothetical protein
MKNSGPQNCDRLRERTMVMCADNFDTLLVNGLDDFNDFFK